MVGEQAVACASQEQPQTQSDKNAKFLTRLTAISHLERENALAELSNKSTSLPSQDLIFLRTSIPKLLNKNNSWQSIYGAIKASTVLLKSSISGSKEREKSEIVFLDELLQSCETLITHTEPRVRTAASSLIRYLAARKGASVWKKLTPLLIEHIETCFALDKSKRLHEASRVVARDLDENAADAKLNRLGIVHETEGWRGLETMLLCFASLANGCGKQMFNAVTDHDAFQVPGLRIIVQFVERAGMHPNRFVREAGLKVIDSIATAAGSEREIFVITLVNRCAQTVTKGLQDNWSQVRFAASVATRTIMNSLSTEEKRKLYATFLPRMCLNRHYVAEGVRNYSQQTWRLAIAEDGRKYLQRHIEQCVTFYERQCEADNHAVREAACQSLSELALRLERAVVSPYISRVNSGLMKCFKDESWPVRDHACQSLAQVIAEFKDMAEQTCNLSEMFDLFRAHLSDNIPSVRENCANAFVKVSSVFDQNHDIMGASRVANVGRELIGEIENQKQSAKVVTVSDSQFGASSQLAVDDAHTNQVMYSCGSLAPKLRRGGGCTDHGFAREKEGWEKSDGGMLVWRALMRNVIGRRVAVALFDNVVKAGVEGSKKSFGGRSRFLDGFLQAISETLEVVEKEVVHNRSEEIIEICVQCRKLSDKLSRRAGMCSRSLKRVVGLRVYAEIERRIISRDEQNSSQG